MLQSILFQTIRVTNAGELSVAQAIKQAAESKSLDTYPNRGTGSDAKEALERNGIKIANKLEGARVVFFEPSVIETTLLKHTDWKGTNVKQLLARIEGAKGDSAKLGMGKTHRGISIPLEIIIGEDAATPRKSGESYIRPLRQGSLSPSSSSVCVTQQS